MPGVESDEAPESCVWQKNHIFTSKGCVLLSALLYNVFKGHLTSSFPTLKKKKIGKRHTNDSILVREPLGLCWDSNLASNYVYFCLLYSMLMFSWEYSAIEMCSHCNIWNKTSHNSIRVVTQNHIKEFQKDTEGGR